MSVWEEARLLGDRLQYKRIGIGGSGMEYVIESIEMLRDAWKELLESESG